MTTECVSDAQTSGCYFQVPLLLVCSNISIETDEVMQFGSVTPATACTSQQNEHINTCVKLKLAVKIT